MESPSGSELAEASRVTSSEESTCWSGPALAVGWRLVLETEMEMDSESES